MTRPPLLQLSGITKHFGALEALRDVTFTLGQGEVHALLGENGAGKSTLMNIAVGLLPADSGTIAVDGQVRQLRSPLDSRRLGIGMVHQHFTSIPALTVAENVALATGWSLRGAELHKRVHAAAMRIEWDLDPLAPVSTLSAGMKQRLEVVKALAADARILLLDEPSSVLSPPDAEALLALIAGLKPRGVSSVLITHKLAEAINVADRVTVLRRGRVVHTGPAGETDAQALARHMLGAPPPPPPVKRARTSGRTVIDVDGLAVRRPGLADRGLKEASFKAQAGEVLGVAAVEGNGERELLRCLAGLIRPSAGRVTVTGPVSFIPEDRTTEALIGEFTLTENLALSQGASAPWARRGWLDWTRVGKRCADLIDQFGVRAAGPETIARSLSGGNQQRMVIAGALERKPSVIVAENITRGLDFSATAAMHARLRDAADAGACVVLYLADLDELLEVADRILVVANGIVSEPSLELNRAEIGRRMLGADG